MRWYWQAILGVALAFAAVAIIDDSGNGPTANADEPAVTIAPAPVHRSQTKKVLCRLA